MKTLFALLVGLILAFVLYLILPAAQEVANRTRQRFYFWLARYNPRLFARVLQAQMAIPADIPVRGTALAYSDVALLVAEHNKVVTKLRQLTAKMDLDAGITDANWAALLTANDAASPALIVAQ